MPFVSVAEAIEEIRAGRILVVVDDEDRENEGDLTIAAEKVTPDIVNFMVTHGRGLICLALTPDRCDYLRLPLMSAQNTSRFGTAFCETIDAREGVSTGVSAADRTRTILTAIDPLCRPGDLARPGHIFPLRAQAGGVLDDGEFNCRCRNRPPQSSALTLIALALEQRDYLGVLCRDSLHLFHRGVGGAIVGHDDLPVQTRRQRGRNYSLQQRGYRFFLVKEWHQYR